MAEAVVDDSGVLRGEIVFIDAFGNAVSNLTQEQIQACAKRKTIVWGKNIISLVTSYAGIPSGSLGALINSQGKLELAANRESAAKLFGIKLGDQLTLG